MLGKCTGPKYLSGHVVKDCGISQETKLCKTEVPCPGEEGDAIREYKAKHEENFSGSWLREDGKGKTKREVEVDREVKEDGGKEGKRIREKGEDEWAVKRKCVNPVSVEDFDIFSQGEISECDSCALTVSRRFGRARL